MTVGTQIPDIEFFYDTLDNTQGKDSTVGNMGKNRDQQCGDIDLSTYLTNDVGPLSLVLELHYSSCMSVGKYL